MPYKNPHDIIACRSLAEAQNQISAKPHFKRHAAKCGAVRYCMLETSLKLFEAKQRLEDKFRPSYDHNIMADYQILCSI